MNETISAFLEELDPFWHFLVPVIVSGFLGCLFGVILSCLFCRPKAAPAPSAAPVPETPAPKSAAPVAPSASPAPSQLSPIQAAARPPEVQSGQAHLGNLGLLYHVKPQDADDLTLITGITPATAIRLRDLGIYRFEQISQWNPSIIEAIRQAISGANQAAEDKWIAQAKRLASLKTDGKPLTALAREALPGLA